MTCNSQPCTSASNTQTQHFKDSHHCAKTHITVLECYRFTPKLWTLKKKEAQESLMNLLPHGSTMCCRHPAESADIFRHCWFSCRSLHLTVHMWLSTKLPHRSLSCIWPKRLEAGAREFLSLFASWPLSLRERLHTLLQHVHSRTDSHRQRRAALVYKVWSTVTEESQKPDLLTSFPWKSGSTTG